MDFTSRMVALLGELRRERNGAVADAMRCYGAPYGLNYGVSLPTLRKLARAETPDPNPLLRYAALHSAARSDLLTAAWIAPAVEAVRRAAVCAAESLSKPAAAPLSASSAARLIAQGAVALLSAVGGLNEENRQAVLRAAGSLGKLPAEDYVHEELTWRLEA